MHISNSNLDAGTADDLLNIFHPAVGQWFFSVFPSPTLAQRLSWPAIARGESTLLLAPTGSEKTLAAFLWCLNRTIFSASEVLESAPGVESECLVIESRHALSESFIVRL